MNLFGFKFGSSAEDKQPELESVAKEPNDGSLVITHGDTADVIGDTFSWSTSVDIDPLIVSETQLITKYREMALTGEIDKAVDIIINEMISTSAEKVVSINLDRVEYSDALKKKITDEFDYVVKLLDFNHSGYEILRRWYIDGRIQYQVVVDKDNFSNVGIGKLTYLDPRKLKKIRLVRQRKDERTGADLFSEKGDFYIFSENGFVNTVTNNDIALTNGAVQISGDAVVQTTSGLLDPTNSVVLSYLHKAIRPLNQLKGLEDATMIYKLSRAPERRIFYIDVGNLPPAKAEQVLQKQMNQYRSKMIYDPKTGAIRSDPKSMTMIEDYWLPRRSDGKATEITTLPSGNLSGEMGELNWFLNKLFNSLNVPITRLDSTNGFSFGKTTEITRDEVALTKFVERLRRRFSNLFLDLLKRQLALKNILNDIEFDNIRQEISFDYVSDNHFDEMLALEVLESRLNILDRVVAYAPGGQNMPLLSIKYIYNNVLFLDDAEVEDMRKQIEDEMVKLNHLFPNAGEGQMDDNGPNVTHVIHSSDSGKADLQAVSKDKQSTKTINNSTNSTTNNEGNI